MVTEPEFKLEIRKHIPQTAKNACEVQKGGQTEQNEGFERYHPEIVGVLLLFSLIGCIAWVNSQKCTEKPLFCFNRTTFTILS